MCKAMFLKEAQKYEQLRETKTFYGKQRWRM